MMAFIFPQTTSKRKILYSLIQDKMQLGRALNLFDGISFQS